MAFRIRDWVDKAASLTLSIPFKSTVDNGEHVPHVIVESSAAPTGAATEAKQDDAITQETAINAVLGVKTDAKSTATDATPVTAMSVWKQISESVQAIATSIASLVTGTVLADGSALIGKVGIDQTTPGTTNAVVASPVAISTATHSNVNAANADTQLLAANANRKPGSTVVNDSTAILYVKLGTGASATSYWIAVDGKTTVPGVVTLPDGYLGVVNGFWAAANGAARVTEMA